MYNGKCVGSLTDGEALLMEKSYNTLIIIVIIIRKSKTKIRSECHKTQPFQMIILCHFDHKLFVIVVVGFVLCWSLRLFCIVFVCVSSVLEIKSGSFNEEGVCVCV